MEHDTTGSPIPGIAFSRAGEIWMFDLLSGLTKQMTKTGGKVGSFSCSPGFRYLAFERVIGSHKESGEWEDTANIPDRSELLINVLDLVSDSLVWTSPFRGESAYLQCWCQDDVLIFYTADDFAVEGYYEYFVHRDTLATRRYDRNARRCPEDVALTDTLMAHGIHLWRKTEYQARMDARGGSSGLLEGPSLAPDSLMAAIFNVRDVKNHTTYLDEVWLHDLRTNSFTCIYQQPARPEHKFISWCPSGRWLGLFFTSSALLFDTRGHDSTRTVFGGSFSWTPGDWLLFEYYSKVFLFDLKTKANVQVLADAARPALMIWKASNVDSVHHPGP
jgi:hypothetical protein